MFQLYTSALSGNGIKPLLACSFLKLNPRVETINVYIGEGQSARYLEINPAGTIPFLVDNSFALSESNAIIQYISEKYGDNKLYSSDPKERAYISKWLFWESSSWQPELINNLSQHVGHILGPKFMEKADNLPNWDFVGIKQLLAVLENELEEKEYITGKNISLADISISGMAMYFKAIGFPFSKYQNFNRWFNSIAMTKEWKSCVIEPWI